MPGELVPIIIVPAFLFAIAYMTRVISDNNTRKTFIRNNAAPEIIEQLFLKNREPDSHGSLKWGLVIAFIGASFLLLQVLGFDADDPITYGIVFLFGGAGLLVHYAISVHQPESTPLE